MGVLASLAGIFSRTTAEPKDPEETRVYSPSRTAAGMRVDGDNAMKSSGVFAAVRYLRQTVGVLPWHVFKDDDRGPQIQASHHVQWMLSRRVSSEWSSFQFRETLLTWAVLWGNGYAEIERDTLGRPFAMWPIHPSRVQVCRTTEGELYYEVNDGAGRTSYLDAEDMFHIRGYGDGVVGLSVVAFAAESIGWAQAAQIFGSSFFGNGAVPAFVVVNKKGLSEAGLKRQQAMFKRLFGGARRANSVAHLDMDSEIKSIGLNAEQTQLIETHQFLIEEQCRWIGVPPHKVMHLLRGTFSNIEHQSIEVVQDALMPWAKRFEDEADAKLFGGNRQKLYTKINLRGLLRGDFKSQTEGLKIAREAGVINADEWREFMEMAKMEPGQGGDKYVIQLNMTTLDKVGEEAEAENPRAVPGDNGGPDIEEDDGTDDDLVEDAETMAARAEFARLMGATTDA